MLSSSQHSNNTRVLVIGVRSEHAHMLKELYSNMNFSFLTDNKKHTKPIKDGRYDKIVFMTKWTKHIQYKAYRNHPGLTMCNGGITSVKQILSTFC